MKLFLSFLFILFVRLTIGQTVIQTNFFGAGVPNATAKSSIRYIDVGSRIKYKQITMPQGNTWQQEATNVLVDFGYIGGVLPIIQGGTGATTATTAINNLLPSQIGHAGQFLQTNGTTILWASTGGAVVAVDTIYRTLGKDSIQYTIAGRYHAILDSAGSGGSSQTLAQTLAIGNVTGGNDLVVSSGNFLQSPNTGSMQIDFGNDTYLQLSTDAGTSNTPFIFMDAGILQIAGLGGGSATITIPDLSIVHNTLIKLDAPSISSTSLTGVGTRMVTATAGGVLGVSTIPTGTVTSVAVSGANGIGVSGSPITTSGTIALTLGAITPTSVNGITFSGSGSIANTGVTALTGFTGSGTSSGTNTGDQTIGSLSPLTTKGDIFCYSTLNTRLAVGATDGMILGVGSAAATGLIWSTPTYPMARGTARTILVSDGTNNVYSTETYAVPGASGRIMTSDGTNWTSAVPATNGTVTSVATGLGLSGGTITSTGTLLVDTASASILSRQRAANTYMLLGAASTIAIGSTITSATAGSVLFAGTGGLLQQINTKFFYDSTNVRLGLGMNTPATTLDVTGTGHITSTLTVDGASTLTGAQTLTGATTMSTSMSVAGTGAISGQIIAGFATPTALTYRTTNGGSNLTANLWLGNTTVTAGTQAYIIDRQNSNGYILSAANGTRQVSRGAINQTVGSNTAGSESIATLDFYTKAANAAMAKVVSIDSLGKMFFLATNTTVGTTGNQTINKASGTVNIVALGTTVTVTNSLCTTSSIVFAVLRTNDATAGLGIKSVVPGAGSFVITLTGATTAEVSVGFIVFN